MIIRAALAMAIAVAAFAPAFAAPAGPTTAQMNALRAAKGEKCPPIRNLKCTVLGDPTEYRCTYQERYKPAPWTKTTALVARDGKGWTWLDGGPRCSALPQR